MILSKYYPLHTLLITKAQPGYVMTELLLHFGQNIAVLVILVYVLAKICIKVDYVTHIGETLRQSP